MIVGKRKGPAGFWWAMHNMVAHPLGEVLHWVGLDKWSHWLHDETVPIHDTDEEGRG